MHYRSGEPIPEDLLRRLVAARTFNQGCATVEYVASALVDLDIHLRPGAGEAEGFDIDAFEQDALARIGMPAEIVMRHRPAHFQHVFAGDGYAAAYYSYMWSEVLDADAFAAFEETGDIFDAGTAKKLHDHVYAAGGARDPAELYTAFRGRLPTPEGLLKRRGLRKRCGGMTESSFGVGLAGDPESISTDCICAGLWSWIPASRMTHWLG